MNCWRCGQPVADGAASCVACGAPTARTAPTTDAGRAMRRLYDRYGADAVLGDPAYLGNGLGDLLEGSSMLRQRLRMAVEAGVGRLYLEQIRGRGVPDLAFGARVRTVLTDDVGLGDAAAAEVASLLDQMVGWRMELPKQPPQGAGQSTKLTGAGHTTSAGQQSGEKTPSFGVTASGPDDPLPEDFQAVFGYPWPGTGGEPVKEQKVANGCLAVMGALLYIALIVLFVGGGAFLVWCGVTGTVQSPAYALLVLLVGILMLIGGLAIVGAFAGGLKESSGK